MTACSPSKRPSVASSWPKPTSAAGSSGGSPTERSRAWRVRGAALRPVGCTDHRRGTSGPAIRGERGGQRASSIRPWRISRITHLGWPAAAVEELASSSGQVVDVSLPATRMPAAIEVAAYFVCAEALANSVKHARATRIVISGGLSRGVLRLTVTDDGVGGADPSGSGIRGLGDRLAAIGGVLEVTEAQGGGTMVSAIVPVTNAPNEVVSAVSPPA